MSLAGRVALVTGGSRGIGRAIALGLARDGADIAVNYRKDLDSAETTVAEIESLGRKAASFQASVGNWDEDAAMVEAVLARFGYIDILVNNAGIASRGQSVADTDPIEMERVVRTHAFAPHYLSKLVLPSMRTRERGDIVMISSAVTRNFIPYGAPYNMGKAAMEALAFGLAKEERSNNIHVNIVAPGLVETEMGKRLVHAAQGVDDLRKLDKGMPFGHVCQPEEVADTVRFVVSDSARYLSAQRLYVDGGGA